MQVQLYKHVNGLYFDDPDKLILFQDGNYSVKYAAYIAPASIWTGDGKTYNIGILEVCEIPLNALSAGDPVYIKVISDGKTRYYYINNIEYTATKAMLSLSLDTFATYYPTAIFENIIATKSTLKLNDALIPLSEAVSPIDPLDLATDGIALPPGDFGVCFLIKIKLLTAKSLSSEAYTTRLFSYKVPPPANADEWGQAILQAYDKLNNIYEAKSNNPLFGLEVELVEMYLISGAWIGDLGGEITFNYVSQAAKKEEITLKTVYRVNSTVAQLNPTYAGYNKILIGDNEITLPAYYGNDQEITIKPVFNINDFDILLFYATNEPISIKEYFKVEVSNTTSDTSLQTIAKVVGGLMGWQRALSGAVTSFAATGGNVAAAGVTGATVAAADNTHTAILAQATKVALPATRFNSVAFSIFLDDYKSLKDFIIYQKYWYNPNSQATLKLKKYGTECYFNANSLEDLLYGRQLILTGARYYVELQVHITGIPLEYSREITALFADGVELIKG